MISSPNSRKKQLKLAKLLWNWEPHPTQRDWLSTHSQLKLAACGRRWGKTEAAAVDIATFAILFPGSRQMVVSPSYDQSRIIADTIERLMLKCKPLSRYMKLTRSPYTKIHIGTGTVQARTADEDGRNLRGQSAERIIVDEAAFVRDSVVEEGLAPMLADRDGEMILLSTPFGKNHFYRTFLRGQQPNTGCISLTFPSTANPHVSAEYIGRQRDCISPTQFAVEYEAKFVEQSSSVFKYADIQRALANPKNATGEWVVAGLDWARYSDYTAIVAMDNNRVTAIHRMNNLPWKAQMERIAEFIQSNKVSAVLADQSSIGDPLNEQLRAELLQRNCECYVDGLVFTNTSKRELVENLAVGFARGALSIPNHPQLIAELQYYEYELSERGVVKFGARRGFHDDIVTALALAWMLKQRSNTPNILSSGSRVVRTEREMREVKGEGLRVKG